MQRTITVLLMFMGLTLARAQPLDKPEAPNLSTVADSKAWRLLHAQAESVVVDGKRAVHLIAEGDSANGIVGLALPNGLAFSSGTIELDLKGKNVRQSSFLGVAFNVVDEKTFEVVYFRPFNFKADEPFRKRAVQYIAWPAHTWEQLRKNRPEQFENAVNPVPDPDAWFHASVEVSDTQVRVFVDRAKEPSLVVERLSNGGVRRPAGLFVDSADGFYADLRVISGQPARR
jgi:hypothetical protein